MEPVSLWWPVDDMRITYLFRDGSWSRHYTTPEGARSLVPHGTEPEAACEDFKGASDGLTKVLKEWAEGPPCQLTAEYEEEGYEVNKTPATSDDYGDPTSDEAYRILPVNGGSTADKNFSKTLYRDDIRERLLDLLEMRPMPPTASLTVDF